MQFSRFGLQTICYKLLLLPSCLVKIIIFGASLGRRWGAWWPCPQEKTTEVRNHVQFVWWDMKESHQHWWYDQQLHKHDSGKWEPSISRLKGNCQLIHKLGILHRHDCHREVNDNEGVATTVYRRLAMLNVPVNVQHIPITSSLNPNPAQSCTIPINPYRTTYH